MRFEPEQTIADEDQLSANHRSSLGQYPTVAAAVGRTFLRVCRHHVIFLLHQFVDGHEGEVFHLAHDLARFFRDQWNCTRHLVHAVRGHVVDFFDDGSNQRFEHEKGQRGQREDGSCEERARSLRNLERCRGNRIVLHRFDPGRDGWHGAQALSIILLLVISSKDGE